MVNRMQFYIDGAWVDPVVKKSTPVVNPATEEAMYEVALGSKADVDKAVAAAKRAFESFSLTSREERIDLLERIVDPAEGGLLAAIGDGTFGLMKRPADRGKGLDGVVKQAPGYLNPATDLLEGVQR